MAPKLQITLLGLFLAGLLAFIYSRKRSRTRSSARTDFATQNAAIDTEDLLAVDEDEFGVVSCVQSVKIEGASTVENKPLQGGGGFIIIRLMAVNGANFVGYELMQALLSAGLRYGSRNIFHYYEEAEGEEKILFSLASAVEPGTFELSQMGSITCPGLTLFMEYSKNSQTSPLNTLTLMLDAARQLAEDLGGQLFTEDRKPLMEQDIKKWRIQFENYEQNKEMGDLLTAV